MRVLIACLLVFVCCSCSQEECEAPATVVNTEQVTITWNALLQEQPILGYVTLQVYSGNEYYEVRCTKKSFIINLKKGDYGWISITPVVIDQEQNEAGVFCTYIMQNSKGIIVQGQNNGTNFLIK